MDSDTISIQCNGEESVGLSTQCNGEESDKQENVSALYSVRNPSLSAGSAASVCEMVVGLDGAADFSKLGLGPSHGGRAAFGRLTEVRSS